MAEIEHIIGLLLGTVGFCAGLAGAPVRPG